MQYPLPFAAISLLLLSTYLTPAETLAFEGEKNVVVKTITQTSSRAWLGVEVEDATPEGALVRRVAKGSPADSAGLKSGDVIVEFGGRVIYEADDLIRAVRRKKAGDAVELVCVQDGVRKSLTVTLAKRPVRSTTLRVPPWPLPPRWPTRVVSPWLGLRLMTLPSQLAEYFQVPYNKGVLIVEVEKGSPADEAGFRAGDVIVKIGDRDIATVREFRRALRATEESQLEMLVIRKGAELTLTVSLRARNGSVGEEFRIEDCEEVEITIPEIKIDLSDLKRQLQKLEEHLEKKKGDLKESLEKLRSRVEI